MNKRRNRNHKSIFCEFDLSLTKIRYSTKKPLDEHMYKVKLIF